MSMIDRAHLDAQTFGDADLAREVLALFCAQCGALLPDVSDAALDPATRADRVHTLRGSAVGIGALAVAASCASLEDAFREGRVDPREIDRLAAAIEATRDEIGRMTV